MKLADLAKELHISTESFLKFIQDFDLELAECIKTNFDVREDFAKFARENTDFLRRYEKDLEKIKSVEDIANEIKKSPEDVAKVIKKEKPVLYDNGRYKSSVSSFSIDNKLGGNYQFVYNYFGKESNLEQRDFIGYRDLFYFISRTLEPFINATPLTEWGIHRPAGIVLYGPPGSGKIFWANKIAEIIGYDFKEVKKYYYGTSFVDGNRTNFNDFLVQMMKQEKVLLFVDDFDTIMSRRSENTSVEVCDEETKEIILHHISHFEEENILMVGAAKSVSEIDREVLAPGRFDVAIPVFPPNGAERSAMILHFMKENLAENSRLMTILARNKADKIPFWQPIAGQMKVFSNTMIVDFTQSLKKRLRDRYLKDGSTEIDITQKLLDSALRDASAKLTEEYLNQMSQFILDVELNNSDDFPTRIEALKQELDHYKAAEVPKTPIGFPHTDTQKK